MSIWLHSKPCPCPVSLRDRKTAWNDFLVTWGRSKHVTSSAYLFKRNSNAQNPVAQTEKSSSKELGSRVRWASTLLKAHAKGIACIPPSIPAGLHLSVWCEVRCLWHCQEHSTELVRACWPPSVGMWCSGSLIYLQGQQSICQPASSLPWSRNEGGSNLAKATPAVWWD